MFSAVWSSVTVYRASINRAINDDKHFAVRYIKDKNERKSNCTRF
jgi:hypothetical protein